RSRPPCHDTRPRAAAWAPRSCEGASAVPVELAPDHDAQDLRGPAARQQEARVAEVALRRVFGGQAVGAEHPRGLVGDAHRRLGGEELGHRRLAPDRPSGVQPRGGPVGHERGGRQRGQHVGPLEADGLVQAAALIPYQAAARLDAGRPIGREAAMAKLFASETAVRITDEAARVFASYGLAMEYPVQRYFRDARFLLPGGGTSEILRLVIGRELDWDRGAAFA